MKYILNQEEYENYRQTVDHIDKLKEELSADYEKWRAEEYSKLSHLKNNIEKDMKQCRAENDLYCRVLFRLIANGEILQDVLKSAQVGYTLDLDNKKFRLNVKEI